jgi:hypothetical protein
VIAMVKTESVLSAIISGALAFWVSHHGCELLLSPVISWLAYTIGNTPPPPGIFELSEIARIGFRIPSLDTWFVILVLGGLAGTSAMQPIEASERWDRARNLFRKSFLLCVAVLFAVSLAMNVVAGIITNSFSFISALFSFTQLLDMALWIGLSLILVRRLEPLRDFVVQKWLG